MSHFTPNQPLLPPPPLPPLPPPLPPRPGLLPSAQVVLEPSVQEGRPVPIGQGGPPAVFTAVLSLQTGLVPSSHVGLLPSAQGGGRVGVLPSSHTSGGFPSLHVGGPWTPGVLVGVEP